MGEGTYYEVFRKKAESEPGIFPKVNRHPQQAFSTHECWDREFCRIFYCRRYYTKRHKGFCRFSAMYVVSSQTGIM